MKQQYVCKNCRFWTKTNKDKAEGSCSLYGIETKDYELCNNHISMKTNDNKEE